MKSKNCEKAAETSPKDLKKSSIQKKHIDIKLGMMDPSFC